VTDRTRAQAIALGAIVLASTVMLAGALTPGYRPWTDAVSRLGAPDEPYGRLWQTGFVLFGSIVAFGAPVVGARVPRHQRLLSALLVAYGGCVAVVGLAPKNPPGTPRTMVSHVHVAAAVVGGGLMLVTMVVVARHAPRRNDRVRSTYIAASALAGVLALPFLWGTALYGVTELLLVGSAVGWLLMMSRAASLPIVEAPGAFTLPSSSR
jgi:hypothetical membrane protein